MGPQQITFPSFSGLPIQRAPQLIWGLRMDRHISIQLDVLRHLIIAVWG